MLARYLESGDESFKDIYVGIKQMQFYWPGFGTVDERLAFVAQVLAADERALVGFLNGKVPPEELDKLRAVLVEVARVLLSRGRKTLDILLVGDCLFIDIMCFLTGPCLEDDITLNPTYLTSKNPVELRKELRAKSARKFDLIFYSPLTYGFSLPYTATGLVRNSLMPAAKIRQMAVEECAEVEKTLDLMSTLYECPILIHNSSGVRRHDSSLKDRGRNLATIRTRWAAKRVVNPRLTNYVARRNAETFKHLHIIDENALRRTSSDLELGRLKFDSHAHHAGVMGAKLATIYRDLIYTHVHLITKKLVVCDLDNTIWEGEIGEGAVRHYLDRQRTLKTLRQKGVVLSVNSKNDPSKVHWRGCGLDEADFVAMQINWEPKVANMKRIQENLNLKYKDYVFIDDRADQREMVADAIPEIRVMDATSARTWELFRLWADLLEDQTETDRTQLYRERDQRESFVAATEEVEADPATLYAKLGIKITIHAAVTADLKRVTELINRTNQFNLCGSRTTFHEVSQWHDDPATHILVVDGADKFGQMGQVSVMVVNSAETSTRIPIFVLSCRVFGYGIETALLNAVKRRFAGVGRSQPGPLLIGLYQETPANEPCRQVYPTNGFTWDGAAWVYQGTDEPVDPSWLTIHDDWKTTDLQRGLSPISQAT